MMWRRWVALSFVAVSATACYRQVVNTGRPAGTTVVELSWVRGWAWGLVAPPPIETRAQCPSGVATVVTETSFQNGLASVLTLGIYTPAHVTITCARSGTASLPQGAAELTIPTNASAEERAELLARAAQMSADRHVPVVLRF